MPQYPESGVKLIVDTSDAQSALDDLLSSLNDIQGQDYSATVTVDANTDSLEGDITDAVPADTSIDVPLNVTETDTAKKTLAAVDTIKNLKVLETVWNIAGTAVDIFGKFEQFAIEPLLSIDDAVAKVNAQTNNAIPNAHKLISGIFYDDLGTSIDQVGKMVTAAAQLGVPIEEATRAALAFTKTFTDQNPETVLNTLNQMVIGKLAPNFAEASDLMVRAFQNGANKGGDLLQVIADNATAIHDLGLSGPESLSFIKTGLDAGFKSAQQVVDVLLKIKQNVTAAAGNQTSDVTKTLNILGIANPAETGQAWSAEFFTSVIAAIKNAPGLTDTDREAMFSSLAGGKQGGKVFSSFLQLSPEDATTIFANVKGAADTARETMDDSLKGAVGDFMLAVEQMVTSWLSSSAIDLPGKITALKTGLQNALNVLAEGGSLSEGLTVALKPLGFDDEFQSLESALGNFVIAILQAVAIAQDIAGQGQAAAGTRGVVGQMAQTQLAFDLKIANPDQVALDIATATSRGLDNSTIADTVGKTIDELIKTGTTDSMKQAQTLIDTLKAPIDQNKLPTLASGAPMNVEPVVTDAQIATLQKQIDDGLKAHSPMPAVATAQGDLIDASTTLSGILDTTSTNTTAAATKTTALNDATATQGTNADKAYGPVQNMADTAKNLGTSAKGAITPNKNLSSALDALGLSASPVAPYLYAVSNALQIIINKANAVSTAADQVAAAGNAQPPATTGTGGTTPAPAPTGGGKPPDERGLRGITSATLPYIQGASSGSSGGNNYAVYNTNLVQSTAQADRLGFSTAEQLRGM